MLTLQALAYIEGNNQPAGPFGTMPHKSLRLGKDDKLYCIIQLKCG